MKEYNTRSGIEPFFGRPILSPTPTGEAGPSSILPGNKKLNCPICMTAADKHTKTRFVCINCKHPVCLEHSEQFQKCFSCIPPKQAKIFMPITVSDGCHPHGSNQIRTVGISECERLDSCEWYLSDRNRSVSEGSHSHESNPSHSLVMAV
ncbi:uncharacterized protein LOC118743620 [Rhagoletis pomonella]|uniref:uncharacterized protein LOC118743620 n=1 Tax=Rhagoletis pomonella TaxID=28610 RepID=UPI0017818C74|nr:uncharacterized protein LOC118743620 [Rhagoletis pomonella]